ncbi:nicotinate phosphoribosyltransferase [Burkholderia stagnalis]|uniref:nicotinate phosphoribosyltransferase n=1 Tax=Burkholderia stagnalis TaxID=1503054 RepID=UPI0007534C14|nr:nicotinate phosphoribosyltransferase [Burkholderia stagnalis]KVC57737.1 nicotinate phosphoribosyltransferase [Burkholderia stagnalis]KVM93029.1 nicotinate phosphoribosyltransferase [Burkholderia stagnalis]KVN19116.1 nicotinate phosphoribosyltransferase [Burkholderia stagnalis]KWE03712.1 nicotinate phosphoribosyltransferase [Burkholderia stagnalis]KWE23714.1 nicotinate phosphoribosyltransferase [Burkholderia stagnalis]
MHGEASGGEVLLTDLYELTMLQAYFDAAMNDVASFEFFVRALPPQRNFLMAAGLASVLDYLEQVRFTADDLACLARTGRFRAEFLASLAGWRFTGTVHAMPEGTVCFADEPLLRITAPLREAQLVESRVMNLLHYATLVASKAARSVLAAPGHLLVDFGLRRAHGAEAGLLSARASYLAGFSGTATVLAGVRYGIPTFGTMAHSYVQAHGDEACAFAHFARSQPDNAVLLIDTYDVERAAQTVVETARALAPEGIAIKGVRLDSGELVAHARRVREILDLGGLANVTIFVSGNLDEYGLRDMLAQGAPIDGFGIGTRMNTSADAPSLDCAYKLVEYAGVPRRKRSEGKATWPGRKQVFRRLGGDGQIAADCIALDGETQPGIALLAPAMIDGARLPLPSLDASRAHAARQLAMLPERTRALTMAEPVAVEISAALAGLVAQMDERAA